MQLLKSFSYSDARRLLINKKVHMKATCELFPNFDFKGTVISVYIRQGLELMLKVRTSSGKIFDVSGNMKGLSFEFI